MDQMVAFKTYDNKSGNLSMRNNKHSPVMNYERIFPCHDLFRNITQMFIVVILRQVIHLAAHGT